MCNVRAAVEESDAEGNADRDERVLVKSAERAAVAERRREKSERGKGTGVESEQRGGERLR